MPEPRDEDAPPDDWSPADEGNWQPQRWDSDEDDSWLAASGPVPAWPTLPTVGPPGLGVRPIGRPADGKPTGGLLDLTLPWQSLARVCNEPGLLGRIGPITAGQARQLADHAARDPGAAWRVIVTSADGQALAVARIPRHRGRPGAGRPGHAHDQSRHLGQSTGSRTCQPHLSWQRSARPRPAG